MKLQRTILWSFACVFASYAFYFLFLFVSSLLIDAIWNFDFLYEFFGIFVDFIDSVPAVSFFSFVSVFLAYCAVTRGLSRISPDLSTFRPVLIVSGVFILIVGFVNLVQSAIYLSVFMLGSGITFLDYIKGNASYYELSDITGQLRLIFSTDVSPLILGLSLFIKGCKLPSRVTHSD